jgi:hypothetical protein
MTHDDFDRLAWRSIDGTASTEERRRLEELLAEDEVAQRRHSDFVELATGLSRIEEVEPPAELRARIDRAIATSAPSWRRPTRPSESWRPRLAFLAAGLVIGVVASLLLHWAPQETDWAPMSGAMHRASERPSGALLLDLGDGQDSVAVWREDDRILADLRLTDDRQLGVDLGASGGTLRLVGSSHAGSRWQEVSDSGDRITIRARGPGRHRLTVASDHAVKGVVLRVTRDGRTLAERMIGWDELGGSK